MQIPDKELSNKEILKFLNYHHGMVPTKDKSIWTIEDAPLVEEELVENIIKEKYVLTKREKTIGFNVLRRENNLEILGKDLINSKLYLSKFIKEKNLWHGYPVDHKGNNSDKPDSNILNSLLNNNRIDKTQMKRIKRGQPL